jgi:hypothetical protein
LGGTARSYAKSCSSKFSAVSDLTCRPLSSPAHERRCPAARAFPAILGPCEADDDLGASVPRVSAQTTHARPAAELARALERVRAFYAEHLAGAQALLSIRFRA